MICKEVTTRLQPGYKPLTEGVKVISFIRLEVGEGIEVEEKDFATEVMSQIEET